ncbi:S24/S26 family peptidase [Candidatus Nomurabacteria bacterium]|nr:S24/S26 family peptidase [Candidatus Nomurabacteria bacterium]
MIIGLRRVKGPSMLPTYRDGALVLVSNLIRPRVGSVVVAKLASEEVIKRVRSITEAGKFYLVGDNHAESVDSREYGPVRRSDIIGVVLRLRRA